MHNLRTRSYFTLYKKMMLTRLEHFFAVSMMLRNDFGTLSEVRAFAMLLFLIAGN